jgi:hypothetical protein
MAYELNPDLIDVLRRAGIFESNANKLPVYFEDGGGVGDGGDGGTGAASSAAGGDAGPGASGTGNGTPAGGGDANASVSDDTVTDLGTVTVTASPVAANAPASVGGDGPSGAAPAAPVAKGPSLSQVLTFFAALAKGSPIGIAISAANMLGMVSLGQGLSAANAMSTGNIGAAISALGGLAGSMGNVGTGVGGAGVGGAGVGGVGVGGVGVGGVGVGDVGGGGGGSDPVLDLLNQTTAPTTSGASSGVDLSTLLSLMNSGGGGQQAAPVALSSGQKNAADVQLMEDIFGTNLSAPPAGNLNDRTRELARLLRS